MKKILKLPIITVFFTLVLAVPVLAKTANTIEPARKVTGSLAVTWTDGITRYVEFNAHETVGDKPANGMFRWYRLNPDGSLIREFIIIIEEVDIVGNFATFSGTCIYDSKLGYPNALGKTMLIETIDGGSPGAGNDEIGWEIDGQAWRDFTIVEGNLVVHNHN